MTYHEDQMTQAQFAGFAGKVAAELGMTVVPWDEHDIRRSVRVRGADGVGYSLCQQYRGPGRVQVGQWIPPTRYNLSGETTSISVAMGRGPVAVATEVLRRLESETRELIAKCAAYDADREAEDAQRQAVLDGLTGPLGGMFDLPGHMQSEGRNALITRGPLGGKVKLFSSGREVEFDQFRAPAEVAIKMMAVYAEWLAAQPVEHDEPARWGRRSRLR